MSRHNFLNVVLPFNARQSGAVQAVIDGLADPARGNFPSTAATASLERIPGLHYMSIVVVEPTCPGERDMVPPKPVKPDAPAHLVIEMSVDGGSREVLGQLTACFTAELMQLLTAAMLQPPAGTLTQYLLRHLVVIGDTLDAQALGQVFSGSPGMTAERIRLERHLARRVGRLLATQRDGSTLSPRQRLDRVRDTLWNNGGGQWKWAFVAEPAPLLGASPDPARTIFNPQIWKAGATIFTKLFAPLYPLTLAIVLASFVIAWGRHGLSVGLMWAAAVAGSLVLVFALVLVLALLRLRKLEMSDPVEAFVATDAHADALLKVENFCDQNHLFSVSRLKPGLLRRLTLRLAFAMVGTGRFVCAPGFLGKNGVIHFARWMRLPDTDQLLFWSNYDGTWDSYVGDFIADAPTGVTAIWSNCVGFPRTRGLIGGGAKDRNHLVRWARRQQEPTRFWYSAYPGLTAARIRTNAAIRQGIASAQSHQDCVDWLSLFGSAPRPAGTLQVPEIPTLVFGGLSSLRYSMALGYAFNAGDTQGAQSFLRGLSADVHHGEAYPDQEKALVVGLSARGLAELGLPQEAIETFPIAFKQGMWTDSRARALGDEGVYAPACWAWGGPATQVDVFVLAYGSDAQQLSALEQKVALAAANHRLTRVLQQEMTPLQAKARPNTPVAEPGDDEEYSRMPDAWQEMRLLGNPPASQKPFGIPPTEPFGFRDGVSQPIIRGTPRWNIRQQPNHVVEPGEFILGYPDNTGVIPPSPSIPAALDPDHTLPDAEANPFRHRPEFAAFEGQGQRDIGANGTFLVVRQLQQDVSGFERWVDAQVPKLLQHVSASFAMQQGNPHPKALRIQFLGEPLPAVKPLPELIEAVKMGLKAKMMGRWQDGGSLIRHSRPPNVPKDPQRRRQDNDFLMGAEDPAGHACPFGAHVRRANPRDTRFPGSQEEVASVNRHRLLRVGRVYGKLLAPGNDKLDPNQEQGLMFMCLNADIERQFEFVQRTWMLSPSMHGLQNEVDPIVGHASANAARRFTIPTPSGPVTFSNLPDFTKVVGGGYFFLPSKGFLNYLARRPAAQRQAQAAPGAAAPPACALPPAAPTVVPAAVK